MLDVAGVGLGGEGIRLGRNLSHFERTASRARGSVRQVFRQGARLGGPQLRCLPPSLRGRSQRLIAAGFLLRAVFVPQGLERALMDVGIGAILVLGPGYLFWLRWGQPSVAVEPPGANGVAKGLGKAATRAAMSRLVVDGADHANRSRWW